MVNFKTFKKRCTDLVFKYVTGWYIKLSHKYNHTLTPLTDGYEYFINPRFKGCNTGVYNPIEVVYFGLKTVYRNVFILAIQGITVDYTDENIITVNISTLHPGLIIGLHGRDIDHLSNILTDYFGQKTVINIKEVKGLYFSSRIY